MIDKISKEYFAFISYQRQDEDWAKWLADQLEHYHLPLTLNGRDDLPKNLRPIFRDIDELAAGNLPQQIHQALMNSKNLIVVCSPNSAKSPWVNKEVETFIEMGKLDRIFPFIVDGVVFSKNKDEECMPEALRILSDDKERLGANVNEYKDGPQRLCRDCPLPKDNRNGKKQSDINEKGRDAAVVKIVAGMLGLGFDTLWQRYEKEKAEEERKIKEQRDKLLIVQSRFLAEKANALVDEGDSYTARLLALEALPKDLENPDRPYVVEAEITLRKACSCENRFFKGHTGSITYLSISPDGKVLASSSRDNHVRLWDIQTGRCLAIIEKPSILNGKFRFEVLDGIIDLLDYIGFLSVEFSPDGKYLIATGVDATIYIWDLTNLKCICELSNYEIYDQFLYATFAPDMEYILSAGFSEQENENFIGVPGLMTWSIDKKQPTNIIEGTEDYDFISYSPDNKLFACVSHGCVEVWDSNLKKRLFVLSEKEDERTLYNNKGMVKFSPKGNLLAFSFADKIRIWDYKTQKLIKTLSNQGLTINSIAYTPDGKYIISGGKDKVISFWDTDNGQCVRKLNGHSGVINSIVVSKDGMSIISAGDDYIIRLWSINNSKFVSPILPPNQLKSDKINDTSIIDKEKAHYDEGRNTIFIDKTIKSEISFGLSNPHLTPIQHFTFSPDENNLLTISYDKDVIICRNLSTLEEIAEKHVKPQQEMNRIEVFSREEQDLLVLRGHTDRINWASYSPDGSHIVSCSDDNTIRVWDATSGRCVQVFKDQEINIVHVEFALDNIHIFSKSDDGTIKTWLFQPIQQLINETCEKFKNRQLTPKERSKYYLD